MEIVNSQTEIRNILNSTRLHGKKISDEPLFCPFCDESINSQLPSHLLSAHPDQFSSANLLSSLEDANLLLTVGSAPSSRPSSPIRTQLLPDSYPVNLSLRRGRKGASAPVSDEDSDNNILYSNSRNDSEILEGQNSSSSSSRKRRKQTHVPDVNKDERYWARRLKNNEAAKRSRDMRIKRERVIFEENARLERLSKGLKSEVERMSMDNKELTLKMGLVLEENKRLKALLSLFQTQQQSKNINNNIVPESDLHIHCDSNNSHYLSKS